MVLKITEQTFFVWKLTTATSPIVDEGKAMNLLGLLDMAINPPSC